MEATPPIGQTSHLVDGEEHMKPIFQSIALTAALAIAGVPMFASNGNKPQDLGDQVRHELVMIPYYSVFDNLNYRVDNGVVTLSGEVTRPVVKDDAERSVKHLAGVTQVIDNIRVLPLSSFDNRIRLAEYRSIYGFGGLYRYGMGTQPSIHIIVDNGHVTLVGVVDRQADKDTANIRANTVSGVFSVTNDLRVVEQN
jgi:hyperosmotically inducible protein